MVMNGIVAVAAVNNGAGTAIVDRIVAFEPEHRYFRIRVIQ